MLRFAPMNARLLSSPLLRVSRIGAALAARVDAAPRRFGCVHSVFERAVNIRAHDDRLLTLHGPGPLAAPFAMALEHLPPIGSMEPGMAVERIDRQLIFRSLRGDLRLAWRGARVADLSIVLASDRGPLAAALLDAPLPAGAPALSSPSAIEAWRRLAGGIRKGDWPSFVDGALRLIGLGEGLTPAGDDCLVGVLAVMRRFRPGFLLRHPDIGHAIASAARGGTTAVAREFLLHALDGAFSEGVIALASAPTTGAAQSALARLLTMGATSGADTAAGMRLALAAIEAP